MCQDRTNKRKHPEVWSFESRKRTNNLHSFRFYNAQKQMLLSLPRQASFSDLLSQVGLKFGIPPQDVLISTRGKMVVATPPTKVSTLLDDSVDILVETELDMIMRRIREQDQERKAQLDRWARDDEGDFIVCSFEQWQLKKGEWGYPLVDFYWPDDEELSFQLRRFKLKRSKSQRAQQRPNNILKEIEMFEELERAYNVATEVTDIVTVFLQLEWSLEFTVSKWIGNAISAFCGCPDFVCTLPENERLLATFWSNVCTNSELLKKEYTALNAKHVATTLTEVCVVEENAKLDVCALAFALRKQFPEAPACLHLEDSDKKVCVLQEWDKEILKFFEDHTVPKSSTIVTSSTTYALKLLQKPTTTTT